jgi:hypothetical protein
MPPDHSADLKFEIGHVFFPQNPQLPINSNECESDYATKQSGLSADSGARRRPLLYPRRTRVSSRRLAIRLLIL